MQPYNPETTRAYSVSAASKLLDCKQFIKHFDEPLASSSPTLNPFKLRVWCHAELIDHPKDYTAPPPELLLLSPDATVADLKLQATKAFQETYLVFQRFQAEQLLDCDNVSDNDLVKLKLGRNIAVRIGGRYVGGDYRRLGQFRMERGLDNWTVDCTCGAKDDDGERMLACDTCGVWQHTRCAGINDAEEVPAKFICRKCAGARKVKGRNGGGGSGGGKFKGRSGGRLLNMKRCKDEIESASSVAGRFGRLTTVG